MARVLALALCALLLLALFCFPEGARADAKAGAGAGADSDGKATEKQKIRIVPSFQGHRGMLDLSPVYFKRVKSELKWPMVVLFTTTKTQPECTSCSNAVENFAAAHYSWLYSQFGKERRDLVFAVVDYRHGLGVFQMEGIQQIPHLRFYTPASSSASGIVTSEAMDESLMWSAQMLLDELSQRTGAPKINVVLPVNWNNRLIMAALTLGAVLIGFLMRRKIRAVFMSRKIWALMTLAILLQMGGGYMFIAIRKPPMAMSPRPGPVDLFTQAFSHMVYPELNQQLGAELYIVASLVALTSIPITLIGVGAPNRIFSPRHPVLREMCIFALLACSALGFSGLTRIFSMKFSGYPFRLFL